MMEDMIKNEQAWLDHLQSSKQTLRVEIEATPNVQILPKKMVVQKTQQTRPGVYFNINANNKKM